MKHSEHLTDQDRADLRKAAELVEEGKALRKRVFSRLRARAHRAKRAPNV